MTEPLESRLDVGYSVLHGDLAELRFSFHERGKKISGAFIGTERVIPPLDRSVRRALNSVVVVMDVDVIGADNGPHTQRHEYTFFPGVGYGERPPVFLSHVCYRDDIPFVDHDMELLVECAPAFTQMRKESGAHFIPWNIRNVLHFLSRYT